MPITVVVPGGELYDPVKEEFITCKPATLVMEHSLLSISKWEENWCVPFIEGPNPKSRQKTNDMWYDYFRCMVISPKTVSIETIIAIPLSEQQRIIKYIEKQATASSVPRDKTPQGRKEQVTSELIYFWMIQYNVPVELCQKWHLSRLLMLINICQRKTTSPGKTSKKDRSLEYAKISAQRRKAASAARKKR